MGRAAVAGYPYLQSDWKRFPGPTSVETARNGEVNEDGLKQIEGEARSSMISRRGTGTGQAAHSANNRTQLYAAEQLPVKSSPNTRQVPGCPTHAQFGELRRVFRCGAHITWLAPAKLGSWRFA